MSNAKLRLLEDRALRDTAKTVVAADVEFLKSNMREQGIASRLGEFAADGGKTMAEGAAEITEDNKAAVTGGAALLLAGIAAWLFREPIMRVIDDILGREEEVEDNPSLPEQVWRRIIGKADENSSDGEPQ